MKSNEKQRRTLLQRASLAALLGGAGITGLIRKVLAAGGEQAKPGMRRVSGTVTVNGVAAHEGTPVGAGDAVETGAASDAVYVIGQDAFLQRPSSRVSFGDSAAAGVLRVITGRLLAVFDKGNRRIDTPAATIGIRGTGCYVEVEADRVYFCLCYGEVDLTPTAAPSERETYASGHHDRPLYIYQDSKTPKVAAAADLANHHDEELVLLEALLGRRPPFADLKAYTEK